MAGVKSVERAFAVLHAVAESERGLVELSEVTDLPTSTAARLLATLEDLEIVVRSDRGRYQIGGALRSMARVGIEAPTLRTVALPYLQELALNLDEAIGLSVASAEDNLTIAQVDIPRPVQAENWEGTRWPLAQGAAGHAVVSTWGPDEIQDFIAQNPDMPDLTEQIAAVPPAGVWWSEGTYVDGLTSAAVPLLDADERAFGTLYVYGPSYRFPARANVARIEEELRDSATRLSQAWRGTTRYFDGTGG